ncbi:MAG: 4,5-DOPA dioxygenase extradiol [Acidimicrobiales bacterium]
MNSSPIPAVFVGHGSPMNAVEDNPWAPKWRALGQQLGEVRGIVCISAHWYTNGTGVTAVSTPRTIHDFSGFPTELYQVQYPAPGSPDLATRVAQVLAPLDVVLDVEWGLDHGTWSVLVHMFPDASIPVIQLSIDATQPGAFHYDLGRRLEVLRHEGILVLGSGNIVHNLRATFTAPGGLSAAPFDWTRRFDATVRTLIEAREDKSLAHYDELGDDARLSIPTPDHYLPFLYCLGARREDEVVQYPADGFQGAGLSMLAIAFGELPRLEGASPATT